MLQLHLAIYNEKAVMVLMVIMVIKHCKSPVISHRGGTMFSVVDSFPRSLPLPFFLPLFVSSRVVVPRL